MFLLKALVMILIVLPKCMSNDELGDDFDMSDVIELNVGGELISTTRSSLTRIPKSVLSTLFNGHWEDKLSVDENENIFFDFNPILFRHLLDQLQLFDNQLFLPSNPSLISPFKKMLGKLGLTDFLSAEKNILTLNIGGKLITNQQTTFPDLSNSNDDVFIDHNPNIFRYLKRKLRQQLPTNRCFFEAPSIREKNRFQQLINALHLNQTSTVSIPIETTSEWTQTGLTIAGNNDKGDQLNQLNGPYSIRIDHDDQSVYVADYDNHRIVRWNCSASVGDLVAGGNGQGNQTNQFDHPRDLFIDKQNDSLIVCDYSNRRIVQWSRSKHVYQQTIVSNVDCWAITMDNVGQIYISDWKNDVVKRWNRQLNQMTIVAGGHGAGKQLHQLDYPNFLVVDDEYSIYVSDWNNHRVMKWLPNAKQGIIVAGGHDEGNRLHQLSYPQAIYLDHFKNIYIADCRNHRIVRWSSRNKQPTIIIADTQLNHPIGLDFDRFNHILVADYLNQRIQKYFIQQK